MQALHPDSDAASQPTRVRWRIFAVLFFLLAVNLMDRITLSIGIPFIKDEFHLSPAMQGLILSSFFWSYALLQVPGGWALDRFGPRKVLTFSSILWGLSQIGLALATGGLSLIFARIALGVAETPISPSGGKMNASWMPKSERGRGAAIMDCGSPLGVAFGGLIIAYLIDMLDSWRLAFIIAGLFSMSLALLAWYKLRDRPEEDPRVNAAEMALIRQGRDDGVAPDAPPPAGPGVDWRSLCGLMFGRATWAMIYFGLMTWGPSYLAQARGFDLRSIGNATFVIFMLGAAGSLGAGFAVDALVKRGYQHGTVVKSLIALSGGVTLLIFFALPDVANPITAVAMLSVASFFLTGGGSIYWSIPALIAHPARAGLVGGFMNMAGSVGGILVPILAGLILQLTGGYGGVLTFFTLCAALYVIGTLFIRFAPPTAPLPAGSTQVS
ncbi:MFS transporter [Pantoea sp. UYEF8]|uniref:MFS transporter n=1 Tax=Pantoea sp. UYEF8 TaxID=1756394 RepID=UPI003391C70A